MPAPGRNAPFARTIEGGSSATSMTAPAGLASTERTRPYSR